MYFKESIGKHMIDDIYDFIKFKEDPTQFQSHSTFYKMNKITSRKRSINPEHSRNAAINIKD
jgi:hypothetical protein